MPIPVRDPGRHAVFVLVLTLAAVAAVGAFAADAPRAKASPVAKAPAAGVVEGEPNDPALAPARDALEREAATSRSTEGLTEIRRPDGTRHVNLRGRMRAYSVITFGADGIGRITCDHDAAGALAIVRATATAPFAGAALGGPRCGLGPRED